MAVNSLKVMASDPGSKSYLDKGRGLVCED